MNSRNRPVLLFRLQPANRFSFPVVLNLLERSGLDRFFRIVLAQDIATLQHFVRSQAPGMVLYSFMTPHLPELLPEVEWVRSQRVRQQLLMAGGPHTSGDPLSVLKAGFDYAFVGAAENGLVPLLQDYLQGKLPEEKTVFYASGPVRLDDSFPLNRYLKTFPPLEITRGCHWNCRFCQTAGVKAQHRSLDSIKQYYRELKKRNYHRRISFICPSAFEYASTTPRQLNPAAVEELLSYCKAEGTIFLEYGIFPSEARPNSFSEDMVDLVVRYCSNKKLTIGAQTGSDRLLRRMRRGHTVVQVERACEITARKGLRPLVDIIVGLPEETPDDRHETLRFIKRLAVKYRARNQIHYFLPLSGTPLQQAEPSRLDYRTIDTLRKFQQDGICTGWWEEGIVRSRRIVEIRKRLQDRPLQYRTVSFRGDLPPSFRVQPGTASPSLRAEVES